MRHMKVELIRNHRFAVAVKVAIAIAISHNVSFAIDEVDEVRV